MPIPSPQSHTWPEDRALLLVHGVGNARPGDYAPLVEQLRTVLGAGVDRYAVYTFYYDQYNDWVAAKTRAGAGVGRLVRVIRDALGDGRPEDAELGAAAAEFAGDVVWPILLGEAREAVRVALLRQMRRMVLDGEREGIRPRNQHLSIIAHSLGCFHAFEALHVAARDRTEGLTPATDGVVFQNVILMASPIQLIRTVAGTLGALVPRRESVRCISARTLAMPSERTVLGEDAPAVRRTVSVTGDLDPVGGYFFGRPYAYMDLARFDWNLTLPPEFPPPVHESHVDQQHLLDVFDKAGLAEALRRALRDAAPPQIEPQNPHAWSGYVARHDARLKGWLA